MATGEPRLKVEVVYAAPAEQLLLALEVPPGTTVEEAIEQSGIGGRFTDLDAARAPVGIFGKRVKRDTVLRDGDRVEIYRPLVADPKSARRARTRRRI